MSDIKQTIENLRSNSFEFGKAGSRFKVYYEDLDELKSRIETAMNGQAYLDELQRHDVGKTKEDYIKEGFILTEGFVTEEMADRMVESYPKTKFTPIVDMKPRLKKNDGATK